MLCYDQYFENREKKEKKKARIFSVQFTTLVAKSGKEFVDLEFKPWNSQLPGMRDGQPSVHPAKFLAEIELGAWEPFNYNKFTQTLENYSVARQVLR